METQKYPPWKEFVSNIKEEDLELGSVITPEDVERLSGVPYDNTIVRKAWETILVAHGRIIEYSQLDKGYVVRAEIEKSIHRERKSALRKLKKGAKKAVARQDHLSIEERQRVTDLATRITKIAGTLYKPTLDRLKIEERPERPKLIV